MICIFSYVENLKVLYKHYKNVDISLILSTTILTENVKFIYNHHLPNKFNIIMIVINNLSISGNISIDINIFNKDDHFTVVSLTPIECSINDNTLFISPVPNYEDIDGKIGYTKPRQSFCQWLCGKKNSLMESPDKSIWKLTFNCSMNINLIESFDDAKVYIHNLTNKNYLDIMTFNNSFVELHCTTIGILNICTKYCSSVELWVVNCENIYVKAEGKTTVDFMCTICKSMTIDALRESIVVGFKACDNLDITTKHNSYVNGKLCETASDFGYCSVGKSKVEIARTNYQMKK